ncbi:MAG TPA: Xaa-Pro peptidase family protein [Isosphaeraceae bacterium]
MPFDSRRQRLRRTFDASEIDGVIVSSPTNVAYLTGFTGEDSILLITAERAVVVSDGRFSVQLAQECPDLEAEIRAIGKPLPEAVGELAKSLGVRRWGFESQATTVAEFDRLREAATGVGLVPKQGLVERLRMIKDEGEIAAIREAVAIAERAFLDLRGWLRFGVTEKAAADFLESALRAQGASAASFAPIVAVGPRAALPHARPTATTRLGPNDLVLVDWGARGHAYVSDLTRVLTTGKVTPEFEAVYRAVLEAHGRAIAAIRPGAEARSIDLAARSVLEGAGFGPHFNHSVGHGIGRVVHESPMLRHVSEVVLEPGMVVTIEPGAYFPEWCGVRIEDDVLVTGDGAEVLSTLPRSFDSAAL